ncbi:MAG: carboxypeptidase regulatory-like domain-containing protein, partial [Acidobacteriota bacterium]|nr:carboxypeptidase regulatory-like domain-containing protein [Acidobacteriota bacterium]
MRRLLALCALSTSVLLCQNAGIDGLVRDQSQAAVPNATVTVVNLDTGLQRTATTNNSGTYSVPLLPVGRYGITASAAGFGAESRPELKLDTQQVARLDFTLKPGALTESINVSAATALLDSETSTVGQVINTRQIVDLPLNGRNYLSLSLLTAGTAPDTRGRTGSEGGFSASGQHQYQVNITVDGLDNTTRGSGGPLGYEAQVVKPSIDAVEEFRVVTNNLSAEYGYRMGGQVFVTTRSGTNQIHGGAYEFLRNDKLDGTNFFANAKGAGKPPYKQNQFGGTMGGPIWK